MCVQGSHLPNHFYVLPRGALGKEKNSLLNELELEIRLVPEYSLPFAAPGNHMIERPRRVNPCVSRHNSMVTTESQAWSIVNTKLPKPESHLCNSLGLKSPVRQRLNIILREVKLFGALDHVVHIFLGGA